MESNRLELKLYAVEPRPLAAFIPVFHRWIREQVVGELAIDVADYEHVKEGPGVVLIGHAYDFFWDQGEGRPGLAYTRKREPKPAPERLSHALRQLLEGAKRLESDSELTGLRFRTDELLVRALDRAHAPPTDAGFAELKGELESLGKTLFGSTPIVTRVGEARDPLSAHVKATGGPANIAELLARLG